MDDIIYERDYTKCRQEPDSHADAVLEQAVNGGFFRRYSEAMSQIPKTVIPQDKENYEYLLSRCDEMAKYWNGRIRGIVDWSSRSAVLLPPSPLRTVHESFPSHGSSTYKPCITRAGSTTSFE